MNKYMLLSYRTMLVFKMLILFFVCFSFSLYADVHILSDAHITKIKNASSTIQTTNHKILPHKCIENLKANSSLKPHNQQINGQANLIDSDNQLPSLPNKSIEDDFKASSHVHKHPHHHHHHHDHKEEIAVNIINTMDEKVKTLKNRAIVASAIAIGLLIFAFVMKRK